MNDKESMQKNRKNFLRCIHEKNIIIPDQLEWLHVAMATTCFVPGFKPRLPLHFNYSHLVFRRLWRPLVTKRARSVCSFHSMEMHLIRVPFLLFVWRTLKRFASH